MEPRKLEESKPPIMTDILQDNRNVIIESLMIANEIYAIISSDSITDRPEQNPSCIMSDLAIQNQNLHGLLDLLIRIKGQIK